MPRPKKQDIGKVSANSQKGKKTCAFCKQEKRMVDFYISKSPLFALDERVPVCKECVISSSLNENGTINELELNKTLKTIDRPYYKDLLESSINRFKGEHSYVDDEKVKYYGREILQAYFTLIAMRQDRNKSYEDSEKDNFVHPTSNTPKSKKVEIARKYSDINSGKFEDETEDTQDVKWSKKDKQNMKYVLSTIGYDPFEDIGLSESDRQYCFNILSGYCDTPGVTEDGHKMQGVIEITMLYLQVRKMNEAMNVELSRSDVDDAKISRFTTSKSSLLSSINAIAKDNNIASNYNKNSKQGQNAITSKMKEMDELGFENAKVNLFDIKTCDAFRQIAELSNQNIANQLTLDSNEYTDIIKEQREIIQKNTLELDSLKEENRKLKNKIIDLGNRKR